MLLVKVYYCILDAERNREHLCSLVCASKRDSRMRLSLVYNRNFSSGGCHNLWHCFPSMYCIKRYCLHIWGVISFNFYK